MSSNDFVAAIQDDHVTSSFSNPIQSEDNVKQERLNSSMSKQSSSSSEEQQHSSGTQSKPAQLKNVARSSAGKLLPRLRKPAGKSQPLKRAFSDGSLVVEQPGTKRPSGGSTSESGSLASVREEDVLRQNYAEYGYTTSKQMSDYPVYIKAEYEQHECSAACLFGEKQQALDEYVKVVHSPLILPFLFGWFREVTTPVKGKKKLVAYFSPCGKRLDNIKEVYEHLKKVGSILPITVFTSEAEIDLTNQFHIQKESIKQFDEDLAGKILNKPYTRFPVFNCFTDHLPDKFIYVKKISKTEPVVKLLKEKGISERTVGCGCQGTCVENCLCFEMYEDLNGYCYGRLLKKQNYIVECNDNCACVPTCLNRVSTNTIPFPLMLYYYPDKGWGVRALCDIPKGSFLAYYYGQIIADTEISEKHDKYLVALDFHGAAHQNDGNDQDPELLNLDGRKYGNIARFMNHSCDPNVFVQVINRENYSTLLYNVAFFTIRNIKAGEELAWDYKYEIDSVPNRRIICMCRTSKCRKRML